MANEVVIYVRANTAQAEAGMAKVKESGLGLGSVMKGATGIMALGLGAVAVESVKMAAEFQRSMESLHTQAGVPQSAIAGLSSQVLNLAGQVAQSPNSLAESLYHIESAFASTGITGPKAMELLKVASEGATVGQADLVDVTNALNAAVASGIPGVENFQQAMGALNAVVGSGDMKMQDLANAMGTGAIAVVKEYGLSLKDAGAALATFGDNNIRGAVAGTQLRMSVQALAVPAVSANAWLGKLGMTVDTLAADMRSGGLLKALTDLTDRMDAAGISASEQGQVITDMFGKKAGTGIGLLIGQFDRFQSKYEEITKGATKFGDAWTETTKTAGFQFDQLKASTQATAIQIGTALLPAVTDFMAVLRPVVSGVGTLVGTLGKLPGPVRDAAMGLSLMVVTSKLLGPVVEKVGSTFTSVQGKITGFGSGLSKAEGLGAKMRVGLSGVVGALGGPWMVALTAGVGLLGVFAQRHQAAVAAEQELRGTLDQTTGAITNETRAMVAKNLQDQGALDAARQLRLNLADVTNAALGNAEAQAKVTAALKAQGPEYTALYEQHQYAVRGSTAQMQAVQKVVDGIHAQSKVLGSGAAAQQQLTTAQALGTTSADKLQSATDALKSSQKDLTDALDSSKNATLGLMGAQDSYAQALMAADDAIKQNGRAIDVNTKAGLGNRQALEAQAKAALDLLKNMQANGSSAQEMAVQTEVLRKRFIATATAMGYGADAAAKLAQDFFGDASAASAAAQQAQRLIDKIKAIPSSKQITIGVTTQYVQVGQPGQSTGGKAIFASGGIVGGAAASGGVRAGRVLVGEHGPEFADLPAGTMVHSAPDTQRMMGDAGRPEPATVVLELAGESELVAMFRRMVRVRGGNVQVVFGSGSAA